MRLVFDLGQDTLPVFLFAEIKDKDTEVLGHLLTVFRRFDFKVGFDYLKPDQAWLLFKAVAENMKVSFHPSEVGQFKARLARLHHLTPGDFAVIQRKSLMVEKKPTTELLLTWLEQEVSSKPGLQKALVGF